MHGEAEDDQDTVKEGESALAALRQRAAKAELGTLLSGEAPKTFLNDWAAARADRF